MWRPRESPEGYVIVMAYELRCADATGDCPAAFTTATEDELLQHVKLHAGLEHPDMTLDDETVATVKGAVRTV